MTLIKVDPGLLKGSAQNIQGVGQNISSIGSQVLGVAQSAPIYDGQFGPRVSALGQQAYSRFQNSYSQLTDLGTRLSLKASEFQAADMALETGIDGLNWLGSNLINSLGMLNGWLHFIPSDLAIRILELGKLIDVGVGFWSLGLISHMKLGLTYPGQVLVGGSNLLKSAVGIVTKSHIKFPTTVLGCVTSNPWAFQMGKAAFTDAFNFNSSGLSGKLNIIQIGLKWGQDYFEYRDEGASKVVSAMAVDTVLTVATSAVGGGIGATAGSWIGGIVGGVIGSAIPVAGTAVGASVGTAIGGVVGRIAGSWAAEWAVENSGLREGAINTVAQGVDSLAPSVNQAFITTAQAVDQGLHNATMSIVDFSTSVFGF